MSVKYAVLEKIRGENKKGVVVDDAQTAENLAVELAAENGLDREKSLKYLREYGCTWTGDYEVSIVPVNSKDAAPVSQSAGEYLREALQACVDVFEKDLRGLAVIEPERKQAIEALRLAAVAPGPEAYTVVEFRRVATTKVFTYEVRGRTSPFDALAAVKVGISGSYDVRSHGTLEDPHTIDSRYWVEAGNRPIPSELSSLIDKAEAGSVVDE